MKHKLLILIINLFLFELFYTGKKVLSNTTKTYKLKLFETIHLKYPGDTSNKNNNKDLLFDKNENLNNPTNVVTPDFLKPKKENFKGQLKQKIKTNPKAELNLFFTETEENLNKSQEQKLTSLSDKINKLDSNLKIISYNKDTENRGIAFTRLLNIRTFLLNKNVASSKIMIMVLENPSKNNLIEIFIE